MRGEDGSSQGIKVEHQSYDPILIRKYFNVPPEIFYIVMIKKTKAGMRELVTKWMNTHSFILSDLN